LKAIVRITAVLAFFLFGRNGHGAEQFQVINRLSVRPIESFSTESNEFNGTLFLRNSGANARIKISTRPLRLGNTPRALFLQAPGASPRSEDTRDVATNATIAVDLSAQLDTVGVYHGEVVVETLGTPPAEQVLPISVERKTLTLPDSVLELPVAFRGDLPIGAIVWAASTTLNGNLRNTVGRILMVATPQVVEFTEKQGSANVAMTDARSSTALDCVAAQGGKPLQLDALEICVFRVTLANLPGAGNYEAKISVAGLNGALANNRAVTVSIRHHWLVLVALILAGTTATLLIRWWRNGGRAQFNQLTAAAALAERVSAIRLRTAEAARRIVIDRVDSHAHALLAELRSATASGPAADRRIAGLRQMVDVLDRWLLVEREFERLVTADRAHAAQERLAVARAFETAPDAIDPTIDVAANNYSDRVRAILAVAAARDPAVAFARSVEELLPRLSSDPEKTAFAIEITALRSATDRVMVAITARNAADLPAALREAYGAYVALATKLFNARIATPTPPGVATDVWNRHRDAMQIALANVLTMAEPAEAESALAEALGAHAGVLMGGLKQAVADAVAYEADLGKRQRLETLRAALQEFPSVLTPAAFENVYVTYRRQAQQLTDLHPPVADPPHGVESTAAAPQVGVETSVTVDHAVFDVDVGVLLLPPLTSSSMAYANRSHFYDVVTNVMVCVLVALAGVQVLWLPNPAWGSAGDVIIAIFWGGGLGFGLGAGLDGILKSAPPSVPAGGQAVGQR
jgi:hypothetical protein